ncbi:MAG TPA: hypothetical protein VN767_20105, partial [Streptosporangiaceae bacterium]|nr:hypothetical protein [Streptosporangiaceae bacterium]
MKDLDVGGHEPGGCGLGVCCSGVARIAGMRASGDLEPDPVPGAELVGGGAHRDGDRGFAGRTAARLE